MKYAALLVSVFLTPVILLSIVSSCFAKEHSRTFPQSCAVVKQTVRSLPKYSPYRIVGTDEKAGTITLTTGGSWTGRRLLPIKFKGNGGSCVVTVDTVYSGLIHNDAGDLLKRIGKQLPNGQAAPSVNPNEAASKGQTSTPSSSGADLTNRDILGMVKAGLPADVLVAKIKTSTCQFDTSPGALEKLKSGGVPDSVILEMVKRGASAK